MQSDEPVLPFHLLSQLVHGEAGGVGGEDGVLAAYAVQAGENLLLQLEVLENGLYYQVSVLGYVLVAYDTLDPGLDFLCLFGVENAPFYRIIQLPLDGLVASLNPLLLSIDHLDREPLSSAFLSNS